MSKINRTVARNSRYTKAGIAVRERHNERKNECYSNPDVLLEHSRKNVCFKKCDAPTYAQKLEQLLEEGVVSTRGLKPDAYVFDEPVFDVNTDYFEQHGGYEYAKQFYAETYELAKQIIGGEQYVISAVMHADERNRELSERFGHDVFHYHLHVVYLPVVEKVVRWSKRCKDSALVGTVKETVCQISHSKKWPMLPVLDEQGKPVLKENGKPRLKSSYSDLQTQFYEHMRAAGFADFERGVLGSTVEHLSVLDYKIQQDRKVESDLNQSLQTLDTQIQETQGKHDRLKEESRLLESEIEEITAITRKVDEMEQRSREKGVLQKKVELPAEDYAALRLMALTAGKLQWENRSLWMQLQQEKQQHRADLSKYLEIRERYYKVEKDAELYFHAMRLAPQAVAELLKGIVDQYLASRERGRSSRSQDRGRR